MNAVVNEVYDLKSFQEDRYEPEDMKKIKDTLDAYPKIYPLLLQAAACPDFGSQLDYNLPPRKLLEAILDQVNSGFLHKSPARYLLARAKLLIYQDDRDEAMRAVILQMQLSRQLEHESLILINYLVTKAIEHMATKCANEVLQAGPVSDQTRAALEAELSLHGSMDLFRKVQKSERAFSLDYFRRESPRPWILSNIWQLSALSYFDEFLKFPLNSSSDCVTNDLIKLKKRLSELSFPGTTLFPDAIMLPAFQATIIASYRTQTYVRSIRIINALQRKVPPDSDKVPTMAELGLPGEVGIDPYNGKTMIIKKLPEGWLVYSVGENLKDDGGKVEDEPNGPPLDVGFGPKTPAPQSQEKDPPQ
jgi:hypothetical protein